jgi:hypothetical protein
MAYNLDVVDQLDLGPFPNGYRADGHGHPAYDTKALLGVLLYGYAIEVRSSRQIELCALTQGWSRRLQCRADGAEEMVHRVHFQQAKGSVLASHHYRGREEHHRDDQRLDN